MRSVQAWERLNDPEYSGKLDMEALHDLIVRAGYSEAAAQDAAQRRGWDRMQAGMRA